MIKAIIGKENHELKWNGSKRCHKGDMWFYGSCTAKYYNFERHKSDNETNYRKPKLSNLIVIKLTCLSRRDSVLWKQKYPLTNIDIKSVMSLMSSFQKQNSRERLPLLFSVDCIALDTRGQWWEQQ